MIVRDVETHAVTLMDIPLWLRLMDKATVLDNEFEYTREVGAPNGAELSRALWQRDFHTLITRSGRQPVIGQFRLRSDQPTAQIVYLAPYQETDSDDQAWLYTLDAMAQEAGKREARALVAEVSEESELITIMRSAGYAVYARQQIWWRDPTAAMTTTATAYLREATEADTLRIQSLLAHTVPPLLQPLTGVLGNPNGWIYAPNDRTGAYFATTQGKYGVYVVPHFHPDYQDEAGAIFRALLSQIRRTQQRPVYVCVRHHQDWIAEVLEKTRFAPGPQQAVMVKHLTARVRQTTLEITPETAWAFAVPEPPTSSAIAVIPEAGRARKKSWKDE